MNDNVLKLKAEVFDVLRAQDELKVQLQQLEQLKQHKLQELQKEEELQKETANKATATE
jgi:hypothetical protein